MEQAGNHFELKLRILVNELYDEDYLSKIENKLNKAQYLAHKALNQRAFLYTGDLLMMIFLPILEDRIF